MIFAIELTLAAAAELGLALAAGLAVTGLVLGLNGPLEKWMRARHVRALDLQQRLHRTTTLPLTDWGGPVLALVVFILGWGLVAWGFGLFCAVLVFVVTQQGPRVALQRRSRKLEGQLVDALVGLSNSLKAGLSLPQAVERVSHDMPAPVSEEFGQILREYSLGKPIEKAFDDTRDRIQSRNFALAALAFRVGKERGGNLAEVFEKIAKSIREIWRLEENIRTVTTAGRSSARFMTIMPAVFLVLLYMMDADSTLLLFTDPVGITVLSVVVLFNIIGHLWIRKILAVDV